jgi:hypothetical protein
MTSTRVCTGSIEGLSSILLERHNKRGYQWWSLEALRASHETVFPESLAVQLETILRDEIPPEPIDISPPVNPPA